MAALDIQPDAQSLYFWVTHLEPLGLTFSMFPAKLWRTRHDNERQPGLGMVNTSQSSCLLHWGLTICCSCHGDSRVHFLFFTLNVFTPASIFLPQSKPFTQSSAHSDLIETGTSVTYCAAMRPWLISSLWQRARSANLGA